MHFNRFPFTIHKEFVLILGDLKKLKHSLLVPSVLHYSTIKTSLIINGGLYVRVLFWVFKNMGQDPFNCY